MILNIIHIILLYILSLYLIIIANASYILFWDISKQLTEPYIVFGVYVVFILWAYLLYVLLHWVYKKTLNKNYLYAYLWFFVFLIIFYYWYYIQYDKTDTVPETAFVTKLEDIDVKDEENWLVQIEKLLADNNKSILYLELDNSSNNYYCIVRGEWRNCENVKLEEVVEPYKNNYEEIDIFNNEMKKIVNYQYFKENIDDKYTNLQWFSKLTRMSFFMAIHKLNNWNPEKAIDIILIYKTLWEKLMTWDNSLIWMIVWITIENYTIDNLNYILDNYELSDDILNQLKNEFSNTFNTKEIFSNAMKIEYKMRKYWFEKAIWNWEMKTSMIFNLEEYLREERKAWSSIINGTEYYYDSFPANYFKRNFIYRLLWGTSHLLNKWFYWEDIDNLNIAIEEINKKIDEKLFKYLMKNKDWVSVKGTPLFLTREKINEKIC